MNLTHRFKSSACLSGSILLSHPNLKDPNFSKSVVFLSVHSEDGGTVGVILNRPLNQTLDQLDDQFKNQTFGSIPVFEGGPVDREKVILAAWEWLQTPSSFKLYFGIDMEKVKSLQAENDKIQIACFLGHSGWSPGQLEDELQEEAWLVSSLDHKLFVEMNRKKETWRKLVGGISEELRLLAEAPDNPSMN